jgi:hypothetical protein
LYQLKQIGEEMEESQPLKGGVNVSGRTVVGECELVCKTLKISIKKPPFISHGNAVGGLSGYLSGLSFSSKIMGF